MNEKKSVEDMTDFQVEDSYVEDCVLNVLVSTADFAGGEAGRKVMKVRMKTRKM